MGLMDALLGQPGVTATGGGVRYDPNEDYWEIRFDTEGNPYKSKPEVPLHPGHTKENQPMFDIPRQDVQPPIQSAVNPTQEHIDPMSLYNRQGRADYTPQDTYNPNTIWGDPSLESLPDPTTDAYAEQDYYAEQDRQAKIEEKFQALLKAQGIKEDELESYNIPDPMEQFRGKVVGQMSPNTSPDTSESLQQAQTQHRQDWADTDAFGTPLSTDDFGQSSYDINAQRQGILDNVMMNKWDADSEDEIDVFNVLGETSELSKGTDTKPEYPSHLTPYAIKMLEEQRKRNEMVQGIGDTATDIYEGTVGGIAKNWYGNLSKDAEGEKQKYSGDEDIGGLMRQNFGQNFAEIFKSGVDAVISPVETADAIASLVSGAVQHGLPDDMSWNEDSKKMASAVADIYAERYGSLEGFKKALAENPAEVLLELTGAGLITKAGAVSLTRKLKDPDFLQSLAVPVERAVDKAMNVASLGTIKDGGRMNVVGKSKDMRDINSQYTAGYKRVNEMDKIKDVTTETSDNNLIKVPEVSIVDLEGKPFITGMADRSEAGRVLTHVNDIELNEGVPLRGGQNYMRNAENYLQGNIWASAPGANTTVLNRANALKEATGQDPLFMPYAMKPTGVDFTHQTTELMINMADSVLSRAQKSALNKSIKEVLPSWKGLGSPKLAEILNNTTGNQRKAIQQILDRDFREIGISLPEARVAISDVNQLDVPNTSLMNIGQLDMNRTNISNHPSYAQALKGDPIGKIKEQISAYDLLTPDSLGRVVDSSNPTAHDYRSLTMSAKGGVVDEKILMNLEDKGLLRNIDTPKTKKNAVPTVNSKVDDGVLGQTTDPMKFDNAEDFIKASIFSHARDSGVRSKLRKSFDNIKEVESADILKPNPNNPKLDSDTVKIKEGLIEEGNRPYILVDGENVIDGHHALQAYRNLGFDEVFVVQKSKAVDSFYNKTTKVDDGVLGQFGKATDPMKFKTADEFIKAQGTTVYHGGTKIDEIGNISDDWGAFYMSDNPTYAKSFGGNKSVVNEVVLDDSANLVDMRKPSAKLVSEIKSRLKKDNAVFTDSQIVQGIKDGKAHFSELPEVKAILKDLGYDGQITSEVPWAKNIGVWNKNVIKTKQQLTDTWNKAHKADDGVLGQKPTKSLALEREDVGLGMEQLANDDIALVGGMRSGNSKGDETRLKYTVYDMKAITKNDDMANANDYILGDVELFVEDGTGKIRGLVELNIKDKKKGIGRKIIDSLIQSDFVNDEFKIHSIKKSAVPFWKKMGVEFERENIKGSYVGDGVIRKTSSKVDDGVERYATAAIPTGGLLGGEETQTDDGEGLLKIKKKVTKPMNSLFN